MVLSANETAFENLIIRDCFDTAVLIADEVEEYDRFESDNPPDEARRLDVTVRSVDFVGNAARGDDIPAGGFVAGEKVHAELIGCRFERNVGVTGGAIAFYGNSLLLEECGFARNNASNSGGAIYADRVAGERADEPITAVTITNCTFTDNRSLDGAEDEAALTLDRLVLLETNRYLVFPLPTRSGGAIFVTGFDQFILESSNFTGNRAVPAGGAVYLGDNKQCAIAGCRFFDNAVLAPPMSTGGSDLLQGGALFVAFADTEARLRIERSLFVNNFASLGGALHFVAPADTEFLMRNSELRNNVATSGGGAVVIRNTISPSVHQTNFSNNTAFVGGAIMLTNGAGLDLPEGIREDLVSRFPDNVAFDGGAICGLGGGTLRFFGTLFEKNLAQRRGGAVCYIDSMASGSLLVLHARMSGNRAEAGGAIFLDNIVEFRLVPRTTSPATDGGLSLPGHIFNRFEKYVSLLFGIQA